MDIFVRNLSKAVTEGDLRQVFEDYGEVTSVTLVKESLSRRPVGFAFVNMPRDTEAMSAINALRHADLKGRTIVFNDHGRRFERRRSNERRNSRRTAIDRRRGNSSH